MRVRGTWRDFTAASRWSGKYHLQPWSVAAISNLETSALSKRWLMQWHIYGRAKQAHAHLMGVPAAAMSACVLLRSFPKD